jgi:hypothetical protein
MPSLKELYKRLDDVKIDADSINLNTDGLESLLATTQADVALIKADMANGVLSDVRDGSGNAITSTVSGAKRSLDVTASVSFPSSLDTNTRDGSGNAITSTTQGSTRRLDVMLSSGGATGSTAPTNANLMGGTDGTSLRAISTDTTGRINTNINGTVPVSGTVTTSNQSLTTGTGTASGTSAVGTDLIASTEVSGFAEASVQFTGTFPTGSATVAAQVSNDNSTWVNTTVQNATGNTTQSGSTFTALGLFRVALLGARYFRLRVTQAGTGGTYDFGYTFNPRATSSNIQSVYVATAPTTAVQLSTSTSYGYTTYHTLISAATTNVTTVRGSATAITVIRLTNTTVTTKYFKLYNSAGPTVGTSTPILNYAIEPNSSQNIDFGAYPIRLFIGFSYAITGGQALLDATAVGAGDVMVNVAYA